MGVNAKPFGAVNIWLILVAVAAFVIYKQFGSKNSTFHTKNQAENYITHLLTDEDLVYTEHAKQRMECRTINKEEVEDILYNGTVNWDKSNQQDKPCPSYALEGDTEDGQTIRIIFADCDDATKVVTVIDLNKNYPCE